MACGQKKLKPSTAGKKGTPTSKTMSSLAPPPFHVMAQSYAPPPAYSVLPPPPAYMEIPGEDPAVQLEQMKTTMEQMRLEKEAMMEQMRLEKDAMMWKMHQEKEAMMKKMELEKETMMKKMELEKNQFEMALKCKVEDDAARVAKEKHIQMEKTKEFLAKEKHWSVDAWENMCSPSVRPIVSAFLKTIPGETVYAIYSSTLNDYGLSSFNGYPQPQQYSQVKMYIATNAKVYTMSLGGDIYGNYRMGPDSVFKEIVTFPSEPTPIFWRAVFSQMIHFDANGQIIQGNSVFTVHGNNEIFRVSNAKLEALFRSFR